MDYIDKCWFVIISEKPRRYQINVTSDHPPSPFSDQTITPGTYYVDLQHVYTHRSIGR